MSDRVCEVQAYNERNRSKIPVEQLAVTEQLKFLIMVEITVAGTKTCEDIEPRTMMLTERDHLCQQGVEKS